MKQALLPIGPEELGPPLWEVGWVRGIERHTLHEKLGQPHLTETDSSRTFGGEEDWWAFRTTEDKVVAIYLRVPYQDAVVCSSSTSPQDIDFAVTILEPWSVEIFNEARLR
jgi:hypothetical protein